MNLVLLAEDVWPSRHLLPCSGLTETNRRNDCFPFGHIAVAQQLNAAAVQVGNPQEPETSAQLQEKLLQGMC